MANRGQNNGAAALTVAALAAAAAGAYYFYGNKGAKHRRELRGWMVKAKGEVMERLEDLTDVTQKTYNSAVNDVLKKYKTVRHATPRELAALGAELRGHWKAISADLDRITKKPATKKSRNKTKSKK